MWYKDDFKNTERTNCPVCGTDLGNRDKNAIFKAHCDDCRATYFWHPESERPSVVMDSAPKPKKYCDKSGCYCRD